MFNDTIKNHYWNCWHNKRAKEKVIYTKSFIRFNAHFTKHFQEERERSQRVNKRRKKMRKVSSSFIKNEMSSDNNHHSN